VKFKRIVAGWLHACGITTSDTVLCWGDNRSGQLGIGGIDAPEIAPNEHAVPARISSDEKFADLSLGATNTCGITLDHRAFCWGANQTGQLGDGTTTSRGTPTLVAGGLKFVAIALGSGFAGGTNVTIPATGAQGSVAHACALTESGAPYCWGWNGDGQLGDGTTTERHAPVAVQGSLTLTAIAAGGSSTCGMRQRAIWCWGANRSGQLGNGTLVSSTTPVAVGAPFALP
jgi:alpha-tubulin suppressor-like RCC1 family protein